MSRMSKVGLKARESVFAGGPELYRGDNQAICPPDLAECVAALEDCSEEAHHAQMCLRSGTQDYPRMERILESQRVFLLVGEATVDKYKSELAEEIEPAVSELLLRAENAAQALLKKESQLESRLDNARSRPARPATGTSAAHKLETRRVQTLIRQREQLESQLEDLERELEELGVVD
ncbi:Spc19-domain-containing protein [Flagelloscypha sp. PMI_526]|nr:Spc19-domain-containing protein [Flagelloscypha sp. PMI_526]